MDSVNEILESNPPIIGPSSIKFSDNTSELFPALWEVQNELNMKGIIKMDSQGNGYEYPSCELLISIIKPICLKNSLFFVSSSSLNVKDDWMDVYCRVIHKKTGQYMEVCTPAFLQVPVNKYEKPLMAKIQWVGACKTYSLRYNLMDIFAIPTGDDHAIEKVSGILQKQEKKSASEPSNLTALTTKSTLLAIASANRDTLNELELLIKEAFPNKTAPDVIRSEFKKAKDRLSVSSEQQKTDGPTDPITSYKNKISQCTTLEQLKGLSAELANSGLPKDTLDEIRVAYTAKQSELKASNLISNKEFKSIIQGAVADNTDEWRNKTLEYLLLYPDITDLKQATDDIIAVLSMRPGEGDTITKEAFQNIVDRKGEIKQVRDALRLITINNRTKFWDKKEALGILEAKEEE
jgi:hypothetical protein